MGYNRVLDLYMKKVGQINKKLTMNRTLIKLVYVFAIAALLISCGKDDDTYNYQNPTEQGGGNNNNDNNNNNNNNNNDDDISQIVSENVSVNVSYQNYAWKITGNTSLNNALYGHDLKYGIYCGYTDVPSMVYHKYYDISDGNFEFLESIFIDASQYGAESFSWSCYINLIQKPNLDHDEQNLLDTLIDEMDKIAYHVKSTYWGQIFVEIDGERYVIKGW